MKLRNKLVTIILIFVLSFSITGEIYRVYVDREFGFWGVRSNEINHTINYTQKTLNIKTGDTIAWENEDSAGDRVTIMSDNLLWEGGKSLYGTGDLFSFTFNSSGIFKFHIAEQNRVKLNASNVPNITTVYNEVEDVYEVTGSENNPVSFENFPYQYQIIAVSGPTIGNGTYPITYVRQSQNNNVTQNISSTQKQTKSSWSAIIGGSGQQNQNNVTQKPTITITPKITNTPNPKMVSNPKLESYQEFTLFEILKRWLLIIKGVA